LLPILIRIGLELIRTCMFDNFTALQPRIAVSLYASFGLSLYHKACIVTSLRDVDYFCAEVQCNRVFNKFYFGRTVCVFRCISETKLPRQ